MNKIKLVSAFAAMYVSAAAAQDAANEPFVPAKMFAFNSSDDYYPAEAKRLLQEGVVVVHACIDAELHVSTSIGASSGFKLLDDAAQRIIQNGKWQAATKGGRPIGSCRDMKLTYNLGPKLHPTQAESSATAPKSEEHVPSPPSEPPN
jgi:TonB family protein